MYASGEVAIGANTDAYDDNDPAALTDFHAALDANGTWNNDPTYGTVWVPSASVVGGDFAPYQTAGHWVYDDDYVWVSDYDWGWAPFHYGRWVYIDGSGWAWVPGRVYRGAWVGWGVDDGYTYVGWYPMAPAFFWFGGVAVASTFYVGPRWVYCPRGEVFSPVVGTRIVAGASVGPVAARVHGYAGATPGVGGGPPPERLGYSGAQIPHATGTAAAGIQRAQAFGRPSTATSLGAAPPTHVAAAGSVGAGGAGSVGGHEGPTGGGGRAPVGGQTPATHSSPSVGGSTPSRGRPQGGSTPVPRSGGGGSRGGGGKHH
jgi:hypothetical protein